MDLPRISIVTPSYNQGRFLEETIQSVLSQNYPSLEYIIIDGGSTDGSVDIINKYQRQLVYWLSEPDKGQGQAINKGFRKATGDVVGWLNSDDLYLPGALKSIGEYFASNPEVDVVYGNQLDIDEKGRVFRALRSLRFSRLALLSRGMTIPQPAAFFRKGVLEKTGYLDESLCWSVDYEFFLRIAFAGHCIQHIRQALVKFRYHETSLTALGKIGSNKHEEYMRMAQRRYLKKTKLSVPILDILKFYFKIKLKIFNLDRYFRYRRHYLQRIKSILGGRDIHEY